MFNFLTRVSCRTGAEDHPREAVRAHEVHPRAREGEVLRHDEGAQRGQRQGKEGTSFMVVSLRL